MRSSRVAEVGLRPLTHNMQWGPEATCSFWPFGRFHASHEGYGAVQWVFFEICFNTCIPKSLRYWAGVMPVDILKATQKLLALPYPHREAMDSSL